MGRADSTPPTHEAIDRLFEKIAASGRLSSADTDTLIQYITLLRRAGGSTLTTRAIAL